MKRTDLSLGHVTAHQAIEIEELQRRASAATIANTELLRLAVLQFEPGHDAFAAIDTLRAVLVRDDRCDIARVWLAYLNVYELMDEDALLEAARLADDVVLDDHRLKAAALWIKGAALRQLQRIEHSIAALEESVRIAPEWVANRMALGAAYRDGKRKGDAVEQFKAALANLESTEIFGDDPFETLITGRAASSVRASIISEQLRAMGT